jgi:hypothetical protein
MRLGISSGVTRLIRLAAAKAHAVFIRALFLGHALF